jgi:alanine dehydrogenase
MSPLPVPHFDREAIGRIGPKAAADAMAITLGLVAEGKALTPKRADIDLGGDNGCFLISGALPSLDILTVKVINVRPGNATDGLARLQGALSVFSCRTGQLLATLDSAATTELRTAACSALSVRYLARPESTVLTVFGTGPQARAHIAAIRIEREISETRIVGHSPSSSAAFAAEVGGTPAGSVQAALDGADVVVAATNSHEPIFRGDQVSAGTHICAVGNGARNWMELDPALFARCDAIRVDHRATCLVEAGELIAAIESGLIDEAAVQELGDVVLGRSSGRVSRNWITVFKSVGQGTQDAGIAAVLLGKLA